MKSFLPQEFRFAHFFAFFHHDLLIETLTSGEKAGIFSTHIKFRNIKHAKIIEKLSGGETIDWLYSEGYEVDVLLLLYKQICAAALSDFCHFIFMALKSSGAAKTTVAYSLFRKPLKDNLFLLEWLLGEPTDFIPKFYLEEPERYEPARVPENRKIEIIKSAINKTKFPYFYDPEFIYGMRYDKKDMLGFEPAWNKAMHIVTSHKTYKTEKKNLNFIFSNTEAIHTQWEHIYSFFPYFLFYAYDIVDALILTFSRRENFDTDTMDIRRLAGFLLWSDRYFFYEDQELEELYFLWEKASEKLNFMCPECLIENSSNTKRNLESFFKHGKILCKSCKLKFEVSFLENSVN